MQGVTQHLPKLRVVCRAQYRHAGHHAEITDIEKSLVGLAVAADKARPVHAQYRVELL